MTDENNASSNSGRGSDHPTRLDDRNTDGDVSLDTLGRAFDFANSDMRKPSRANEGCGLAVDGFAEPAADSDFIPGDAPTLPRRYAYRRLLGCGGMGEVYLVLDHVLGRNVALKVLRREGTSRVDLHRRFVEEAQIGGQLQHPGIVPIYDFGTLDSGISYFTMKYVKGQTLSDSLEQHGVANDVKVWLDPFVSVCQTLAYAHSKNVIHRDLKASNIMVGAFGEVQVLDWGLAKVVGQPDESAIVAERNAREDLDPGVVVAKGELSDTGKLIEQTVTVIQTPSSPDSHSDPSQTDESRTRIGSVIGTLAYMPPEQANGLVHEMDFRSDVFALGSILCRILTGYPAYREPDGRKLLQMVRQGDLQECYQRLDECGCDDALKAIVREALSPNKLDRPANAGELAHKMIEYRTSLEDRLRVAELDRAASGARAEEAEQTAAAERRRRRLSTMLLSIVIIGFAGSLAVGWWIARNREALADAERRAALVQQNQIEELKQRQREIVARIDKELTAGATSLADIAQEAPTQGQLDRARAAVLQAEEWQGGLNDEGNEVHDRVASLRNQWEEINETILLLNRIEKIRFEAMDQDVSAPIVRSWSVEEKPHFASGIAIGPTIEALQEWGLDLQSPEQGLDKLERLPEWARSRIEIHLRLLQVAVAQATPATMRAEIPWRLLQDGQYDSKGGAQLVQRQDGSIEAIGKNPICDVYQFDFPLSDSTPELLRIEALPSTRGEDNVDAATGTIGRGPDGSACMSNLVVELVQGERVVPISIVSSEASFCFRNEPLTATHWNLTLSPTRQQWAIFRLDDAGMGEMANETLLSEASPGTARVLRITFHNHSIPRWGDQNFARLRLSVSDHVDVESTAANVDQIVERLNQANQDPWTQQLWASLQNPGLESLQRLLSDPSASEHPVDHIILLSDLVNQSANDRTVEKLRNEIQWQTKDPRIGSNVDASLTDDGWITVTPGQQFDVTLDYLGFPKGHPAPTAFRIDTFDDSALSDRAFQRVSILELFGRGHSYGGAVEFKKTNVMADQVRSYDGPIQGAFNQDYGTAWKFAHPPGREVCSCIVKVEFPNSTEFRDGLRVRVYSSKEETPRTKRLTKIRVYWTFDEIEWFNIHDLAYELLQQSYVRSMDNERLLLALAENRMGNWLATGEDAMGYATAAVSLRPNDANALDRFIALTLRQNPDANSDLTRRVFSLAKRQLNLALNDRAISKLQVAFIERANECLTNGKREAAAEFLGQAFSANPDQFTERVKLASCMLSLGQFEHAEQLLREQLELHPSDADAIIVLSRLLGETDRAQQRLSLLKSASRQQPDSLPLERQFVQCYLSIKDHENCLASMRKCVDLGAGGFEEREMIAWLLSDLGRDDEAFDEMERALEHAEYESQRSYAVFFHLATKGPDETAAWVRHHCRQGWQNAGVLRDTLRNALIAWSRDGADPLFVATIDARRRRPALHRLHTLDNIEFLIEIVLEEFPEDGQTQLVAALVFFECGRYDEALELARKYWKSKSKGYQFLGPMNQMGIEAGCLHRLGQTDEALPIYRKMLRSPDAIGGALQFYSMSFLHSHPALLELKEMLDAEEGVDDSDTEVKDLENADGEPE
ncbi:serine/threonine-protein kinase [Stieleria varia]|uniref:Serine/threonine-protein kinase PknD n=1 Tax=Stieleria varia TaxID=2528005 RepID=A0A5C6AU79_9BACT|nr:serine/threonine-protein kinase [Stieleria varia]TWU02759.1 Serine/threonine-protein kinase PknD [Stieleria varia]